MRLDPQKCCSASLFPVLWRSSTSGDYSQPDQKHWGQLWGQLSGKVLPFSAKFRPLGRLFSSVPGHHFSIFTRSPDLTIGINLFLSTLIMPGIPSCPLSARGFRGQLNTLQENRPKRPLTDVQIRNACPGLRPAKKKVRTSSRNVAWRVRSEI